MKIFSSFDTNFEVDILQKEIEKHWKDKILIVHQWQFFLWFFIIIPIVLFVWIMAFFVYLWTLIDVWPDMEEFVDIFITVTFIILLISWIRAILKKYIDLKLDFCIITPTQIIYYDQTGLFSRKWRTVEAKKLKTISVNKKWLIRSIFNFGNIVFLSEWDDTWRWDVNLYYIDSPDKTKAKAITILNK